MPSHRYSLKGLDCTHSDDRPHLRTVSLFFVTTSSCREWVICAPAAILRRSGHFSGPFSGVEPLSSVTRHNHGSQVHYHRKLIRQTLERHVAGARPCDQLSYSESARDGAEAPLGFALINALFPRGQSLGACISSRITTVIHVGCVKIK